MTAARRVFLIAEAGVNHNGDFDQAVRLVEAAAEAGADAVKFQTFVTDRLVARGTEKAVYQKETTSEREDQFEMLKRLEMPPAWHAPLRKRSEELGLEFLSTPFDETALADLLALGMRRIKIASGEITNLRLLTAAAESGREVLLSTGAATLEEIAWAVDLFRKHGYGEAGRTLILLHCVSSYPTPIEEANLRAIRTMAERFGLPVGLSDHTEGLEAPVAAVALGACVIEKHLTLDRNLPGPDHRTSLDPPAFRRMVESVRRVEMALGTGEKEPMPCERETRRLARRSLFLRRSVRAGAVITAEDLVALRPGGGIDPRDESKVVGKTARRALSAGVRLSWEDLR